MDAGNGDKYFNDPQSRKCRGVRKRAVGTGTIRVSARMKKKGGGVVVQFQRFGAAWHVI